MSNFISFNITHLRQLEPIVQYLKASKTTPSQPEVYFPFQIQVIYPAQITFIISLFSSEIAKENKLTANKIK